MSIDLQGCFLCTHLTLLRSSSLVALIDFCSLKKLSTHTPRQALREYNRGLCGIPLYGNKGSSTGQPREGSKAVVSMFSGTKRSTGFHLPDFWTGWWNSASCLNLCLLYLKGKAVLYNSLRCSIGKTGRELGSSRAEAQIHTNSWADASIETQDASVFLYSSVSRLIHLRRPCLFCFHHLAALSTAFSTCCQIPKLHVISQIHIQSNHCQVF